MARHASFAKSRTIPTVVRSSKMASRIVSLSTVETWMLSRTPWWKSTENSVSPRSSAMAAVEEKAPAARAPMDTVSKVGLLPVEARSCPLRSMSRASEALASSRKLESTCPMRVASFSWMTRS